MGAHAGYPVVGLGTLELELYVLVDFLEALVAEQLGLGRRRPYPNASARRGTRRFESVTGQRTCAIS